MEKLKVGDFVTMNNNYHVSERNRGRIFEVESEPYEIGGTLCVKLKDWRGAYAADGLTLVKRPHGKKQLIIAALDKVGKTDLPYVIKDLKAKTTLRLVLGEMSKEDADLILETCEEYLANNAKA